MFRVVICCLTVLTFAATCRSADFAYYSDVNGKLYCVSFSIDDLKKTPPWKEGADNPPLSVRKAITIARRSLDAFVTEPQARKGWVLHSIKLDSVAPPERWVYCAEFLCDTADGIDEIRIVVMMDGSTPPIKPAPKQ